MKKSTLFVLSSLCAASLFAGTPMEVVGGNGTQGGRTPIPSGDYDIVLKPNESNNAMFNGGFGTVNSLTTSGSPSLWNIAYGLTIDVKTASNDVIEHAFDNNGKMSWRIGGVNFKNSLGSSAIAMVDFGEELQLVHNNGTNESTWMSFDMNANVGGTYLNATMHARTGLKAGNGAVVGYRVANSTFSYSGSGIFLGGNSTFNNTGAMVFNSGTVLDIETGSVFNTIAAPTFKEGSTVNVRGEYNYTGANSAISFASDINVSGTFTAKTMTVANVDDGSSVRMNIAGNTAFQAGSKVEIKGALAVYKNLVVDSANDCVKLHNFSDVFKGRVMLFNSAELTLNKENAITRVGSDGSEAFVNLLIMSNGTKLILNASNKFDQLYYSGNNNSVDVVLDDSSTLFFQGMSATAESGNYLNITNFEDNRIFFANKENAENWLTISATTKDGKTYTLDNLEFEAGLYTDGTNGYWLNVSVPEPAEWAMIFGAVALGFAIYRRRK